MEALAAAHLIDGRFHGVAAGFWQRLGDVADAEADDRRLRVGLAEGLHPPGDLWKQVASLELEVVAVDLGHGARCGPPPGPVSDGAIVLCGLLAHLQGRLHPDARADLEARFHRGDQ